MRNSITINGIASADKLMTVVIPAYNEEQVIEQTASVLKKTFSAEKIPCRLLFVDDGSTDGTWVAIENASRTDISGNKALDSEYIPNVLGIRFSRNFGKEAAMFAGLDYAANSGSGCVLVMDADLQHPPAAAVEMYRIWEKGGVQIVEGVKKQRQHESAFSRICAKGFYAALKSLSGLSLDNASDFKLLDQDAVKVLCKMQERHTFFRAMTSWTGLKTVYLEYETALRAGGHTKFSRMGLIKLAVNSITSYSSAPLHFVTLFGVIFCVFAVLLGAHTIYMKFAGNSVEGFTTVIILLLIIGGIIMIALGTIGCYTAKIYDEIKGRPRYIVGQHTDEISTEFESEPERTDE